MLLLLDATVKQTWATDDRQKAHLPDQYLIPTPVTQKLGLFLPSLCRHRPDKTRLPVSVVFICIGERRIVLRKALP